MKVGLDISLMIFLLPQFQLVKSFYDSSLWQAVSKMIQNVAVLANKFIALWLRTLRKDICSYILLIRVIFSLIF